VFSGFEMNFGVEKVLDYRQKGGVSEFFVQWKGTDASMASWVPQSAFKRGESGYCPVRVSLWF
jgi:hypothetical protein